MTDDALGPETATAQTTARQVYCLFSVHTWAGFSLAIGVISIDNPRCSIATTTGRLAVQGCGTAVEETSPLETRAQSLGCNIDSIMVATIL